MALEASDLDVEQFAGGLSQAFLECRELGHSWRPRTAKWNPDSQCFDRTLGCARCKTLRLDRLSESGAKLGGYYVYAEGYLVKDSIGRIVGTGRDVLRREALWRLVGDPNERKRLTGAS